MLLMASGYATGYSQKRVRERAKYAAQAIKKMLSETGANSVVVHGNSGVSCGFAALMYANFNLVLLRKDNDNSHGSPIEGPDGHLLGRYIILDDFIASGKTMNTIRNKITSLAHQAECEAPVCVGAVLYGYGGDRFHFEDTYTIPVYARW